MPPNPAKVAGLAARGMARAHRQREQQSPFDVWTNTGAGISADHQQFFSDPVAYMEAARDGRARQDAAMNDVGQWESSSVSDAWDSTAASFDAAGDEFGKIAEADGALATVGAVFATMTALEQTVSTMFSAIPFPAFPAVRVMDTAIGLPHAHAHPPNLIPPAPPVPFPSAGPVIPIPYISGAATVLINNMPAGRCGDMGMGIWCGGYFPMYEIFLGSSSVWLEGARAARVAIDITKHCIFTTPKPQDPPIGPMVGTTISSSPNVLIGGIPMPSLTSAAVGAAFKAVFKGLGKLKGLAKAADDVAEEAGEAAGRAGRNADEGAEMFSRGKKGAANPPRPNAVAAIMEEAKQKGVTIQSDADAVGYLDYRARQMGMDPADVHAVTLGDDLIMVRPEHVDNPRVLREEMIHTDQARAGQVSTDPAQVDANEIAARRQIIENADEWEITPEEIAEMQEEIAQIERSGY